jgi:hypothetical protein
MMKWKVIVGWLLLLFQKDAVAVAAVLRREERAYNLSSRI